MTIAQLQTAFQDFISSLTRIDQWGIDHPINLATTINGQRYPANSAIALPARDLEFEHTGTQIDGYAAFEYKIAYRYSNELKKEQLPLGPFQELIEMLNTQMLLITRPSVGEQSLRKSFSGRNILDIQNGIPNPKPAIIAKMAEENGDWLLVGTIRFRVKFNSIPDPDLLDILGSTLPPEPAIPVTEIRGNIWRSPTNAIGNREVSGLEGNGVASPPRAE